MSYTDPCRGDCGANHWPDCSPECSSRKPIVYSKEQKDRWKLEEIQRIYQCKRCGETSDY